MQSSSGKTMFGAAVAALIATAGVAGFARAQSAPNYKSISAAHIQVLRDQVAAATDRSRDAEARLTHVQQQLRDLSGRFDVTRSSMMKSAQSLDEQIESLRLEQEGGEARRNALEEVIKEQTARASNKASDDPVAAELEKLAAIRGRALGEAEKGRQAGVISIGDFDNAAAAVSEAKARLAERRQLVAAQTGFDALPAWNRELLNLTIADAERRAKLKFLTERRNVLIKCLPLLEESSRIEDEYNDDRDELRKERLELGAADRQEWERKAVDEAKNAAK
jgi:TolA-binding protein